MTTGLIVMRGEEGFTRITFLIPMKFIFRKNLQLKSVDPRYNGGLYVRRVINAWCSRLCQVSARREGEENSNCTCWAMFPLPLMAVSLYKTPIYWNIRRNLEQLKHLRKRLSG